MIQTIVLWNDKKASEKNNEMVDLKPQFILTRKTGATHEAEVKGKLSYYFDSLFLLIMRNSNN